MQALQIWNEPNLPEYLTPQYEGKTAVGAAHYREMLNGSYAAVKAVDPAMLVVTAGNSPYGDPPGGSRTAPVEFDRQLLCVRRAKRKKKQKRRRAAKQGFVRAQGCPAPARFDVFAHHPINITGGPRKAALDPDRNKP